MRTVRKGQRADRRGLGSHMDADIREAGVEDRFHFLPHRRRQRLTTRADKVRQIRRQLKRLGIADPLHDRLGDIGLRHVTLLWQRSGRIRPGGLGLCPLWVLHVRLHQRRSLNGPLPRGLLSRERLLMCLNGPLLRGHRLRHTRSGSLALRHLWVLKVRLNQRPLLISPLPGCLQGCVRLLLSLDGPLLLD